MLTQELRSALHVLKNIIAVVPSETREQAWRQLATQHRLSLSLQSALLPALQQLYAAETIHSQTTLIQVVTDLVEDGTLFTSLPRLIFSLLLHPFRASDEGDLPSNAGGALGACSSKQAAVISQLLIALVGALQLLCVVAQGEAAHALALWALREMRPQALCYALHTALLDMDCLHLEAASSEDDTTGGRRLKQAVGHAAEAAGLLFPLCTILHQTNQFAVLHVTGGLLNTLSLGLQAVVKSPAHACAPGAVACWVRACTSAAHAIVLLHDAEQHAPAASAQPPPPPATSTPLEPLPAASTQPPPPAASIPLPPLPATTSAPLPGPDTPPWACQVTGARRCNAAPPSTPCSWSCLPLPSPPAHTTSPSLLVP